MSGALKTHGPRARFPAWTKRFLGLD